MTANVDRPNTAYRQGYTNGFSDGKNHKPRRPRLPFWRALFSNSFQSQYLKAYRQGYFDGEREARNTERQRLSNKDCMKSKKVNQAAINVKNVQRRADIQRPDNKFPSNSDREF